MMKWILGNRNDFQPGSYLEIAFDDDDDAAREWLARKNIYLQKFQILFVRVQCNGRFGGQSLVGETIRSSPLGFISCVVL